MKNKNRLKIECKLKPSIYEIVSKNLTFFYLYHCLDNVTKVKVAEVLKLIGRDSILIFVITQILPVISLVGMCVLVHYVLYSISDLHRNRRRVTKSTFLKYEKNGCE